MNISQKKPPVLWSLIILFFVIFISLIGGGIFYYSFQKRNLSEEKVLELEAISELKIRQIIQWRFDRLGNAAFLGENTLMVRRMSRFLMNPGNSNLRVNLLQSLNSLTENFDYTSALLLDTAGNVRLAFPIQDTIISDHHKPMLPQIIRQRKVFMTDLHRADKVNFVHLDLIIPLIDYSTNDTLVLGLLALRIDPQIILYPLVESWPIPSKSAETLLVRREGNEIVYLNELRHTRNSELLFKKSLSSGKLAASMAIGGIRRSIDAIDYRDVSVVAAMNKIPGTNWYMIAKIDKEEILGALNRRMIMVIIILILLLISSGSFIGFILRNQRVMFYREKYESELDRLALVKHFDYILKFANDIILLIDKDLKIVEANDRALEVYMYARDEFIGMGLDKIRAPETLPQLIENIRYVNENESGTFETVHMKKDGTTFPIEISTRVVNIEGLKYYQTIGRDITERKITEETLKDSEEKFRKIFEVSPYGIIMTGKDFGFTRVNKSFCDMIGYSEDELKALTFKNITHPDHTAGDEISLMRLVSGEIPVYQTEKRYIRKDGKYIWASTTVNIMHNSKGEVQFFLVMVEEITLRKESEAALEKSYSIVKATLESTEDGILVVDSKGKIVQFNQKFSDMWGIPQKILDTGEDKASVDFVQSQLVDPESFLENVRHLYSEPEATSFDLLLFKDGRSFERYSQPQEINEKSVGRVWSFRDITEKKRAEEAIIAAKEKAEESDRLKTAFLHNVSHEIRTPMNAIIGFSSLLNEPGLSVEERDQYGDIIFQSSNQLLSVINDIVDIANVETGQVKINLRETNLNTSLRNVHDQFRYKESEKGIRINLTNGLNDEESWVKTDITKLIQIISNLLNNSFKFTKHGTIDFGYIVKDGFLEFKVSDTGIGIAPEHLSKVFDRFYQVDSAGSRQFGGTGLGLSICKAYVELLGGQLNVESELNIGTCFTFSIPYLPV